MAVANQNFINATAFAAEKVIKRDFKDVWTTAHALLDIIRANEVNFNKMGTIKDNKLILPLIYTGPSTAVDGVADSAAFTALTPYALAGFTQAEWEFSRYHGSWYLRPHERKLLMQGVRGNIIGGAVKQMMGSFKEAPADDVAGNTGGQRQNLQGLRHALSATNTVGGIDQSDGSNGFWHAKLDTTGGTFTVGRVDDAYDAISAEGRSAPDLLLLSYNSTVNLFGKMRDNVASMQRINAPASVAKFGFPNFEYMGIRCVQDTRLGSALSTTGGFMLLKTDTWYAGGDPDPVLLEDRSRLEGTGAYEYYYEQWLALGCDDIATNAYSNGFTG